MASKVFLAKKADILPNRFLKICLGNGREILLFNKDNQFFALDNACPHMGGPLSEGEYNPPYITCPWHGWQFDITNGSNLDGVGEDASVIPLLIDEENIYLHE
ncbi:MAG: Rieske (2Fe-2S) protein [Parachlamydiaceae bacterium]